MSQQSNPSCPQASFSFRDTVAMFQRSREKRAKPWAIFEEHSRVSEQARQGKASSPWPLTPAGPSFVEVETYPSLVSTPQRVYTPSLLSEITNQLHTTSVSAPSSGCNSIGQDQMVPPKYVSPEHFIKEQEMTRIPLSTTVLASGQEDNSVSLKDSEITQDGIKEKTPEIRAAVLAPKPDMSPATFKRTENKPRPFISRIPVPTRIRRTSSDPSNDERRPKRSRTETQILCSGSNYFNRTPAASETKGKENILRKKWI